MIHGKLILIPTLLGDTNPNAVLPLAVWDNIAMLNHYAVEDIKTARRFLKKLDKAIDINSIEFFVLNKHTSNIEAELILQVLVQGFDVGLMSEAGLPGVADPGSNLVSLAHKKGILVKPLSGPSSIFMALMASGLNGQNFAFSGYLPQDEKKCKQRLVELELKSKKEYQTQIFMETPYRNNRLIQIILDCLHPNTQLCIACDISIDSEFIETKTISSWKKSIPDLNKRPAIFIIQQ